MAVIYRHPVSGELGFRINDRIEAREPLPAGTTVFVRFDHRAGANGAKLRALQRDPSRYSFGPGPTLFFDGQPVSFDPPTAMGRMERDFIDLLDRIDDPGTLLPADVKLMAKILGHLWKKDRE